MYILLTNVLEITYEKIFNVKNLYIKVLVIIFVIYVVSVLINQQSKLNNYKEAQAYYQQKIDDAQTYQESLKALKDNINSPEYIEEVAREKLDMYLPNERVYVDVGTK